METKLKEWIVNSNNVFDLYAYLYTAICSKEGDYATYINSNGRYKVNLEMAKLRIEFRSVLYGLPYVFGLTNQHKELLINLIDSSKDKKLICYELMNAIDFVYGELAKNNFYSPFDGINEEFVLNTEKTKSLGNVIISPDNFLESLYDESDLLRNKLGTTIKDGKNKLVFVPINNTDYKINYTVANDINFNFGEKQESDSLRLGLCSVTGNEVLKFKKKENYFDISGVLNESIIQDKIIRVLENMVSNKLDIVVLPEMVITENIVDAVSVFLRNNYRRHSFKLLIMGSIWSENKNCSIVLDKKGRVLTKQLKINSFQVDVDPTVEGCVENLKMSSEDRNITIFDIPKLGRIAVVICADFISDEYLAQCFNSKVNFLVVPTYTRSLREMQSAAGRLENRLACIFNCNTCTPIISKIEYKLNEISESDKVKTLLEESYLNFVKLPLKSGRVKYPSDGLRGKTCFKENEQHICDMSKICYQIVELSNCECLHKHIRV